MAYLSDSIVRRVDCLQTLLARDTNSDVGSLDHTDIICSITDRQTQGAKIIFDQSNDLSLLQRRYSAADDSVTLCRQVQEKFFGGLLRERLYFELQLEEEK